MVNPQDYSISVRRGVFDGEICFEAKVKELPDIAEYADSYEEAYELAIDSIETTAEIFAEKGRTMPLPVVENDDFSGRVTLRLPKTLHRALATAADEESVSLNQYLCNVLAYYSGFGHGLAKSSKDVWSPVEKVTKRGSNRVHLKVVKTEQTPLRNKEVPWLKSA